MDFSLMWLVWLGLAGAVMTAIVMVVLKNGRQTESVTQVLYDVEQSTKPRR